MRCPNCRVVLVVGRGGLHCFKCDYVLKTKDLRTGNRFWKDRKEEMSKHE